MGDTGQGGGLSTIGSFVNYGDDTELPSFKRRASQDLGPEHRDKVRDIYYY